MEAEHIDATLKSSDLISLYTEIKEEEVSTTRSVILSKTTNNELVLIDYIQFFLFISIPSTLLCEWLLQFMINSYSYTHYKDETFHGNEVELDNGIVSERIKHLVDLIDRKNCSTFDTRIPRDYRLIVKNMEVVKFNFSSKDRLKDETI